MHRSVSRLAHAAREGKKVVAASSLPSPYTWINPATPGPSSGPLAGRSVAIKDNISCKGAPTTCGSDVLDGYEPPYDATCVRLLKDAGAHICGKTKMDEFGMGSQNTHMPSSWSPVHNPSGPRSDPHPRSAGGSSGGSAVAVAEGSAWAALGTDTGGSVRLPASYCGIVGLKPSYGMISRHGVVSYADSLDCVGVLGKDIASVREVYSVVSQPDTHDMTCASAEDRARALDILQASVFANASKNIRIGLPIQTHLEAPNVQLPESLLQHLKQNSASLHAVDMPSLRMALPAYYVLASAEAASNLGRYGGGWYGSEDESEGARDSLESGMERRRRIRTDGFGDEVRKRILAGTHALTKDAFNNSYLKALHLRRLVRREFDSVFRIPHPLASASSVFNPDTSGMDILLLPTAVSEAPQLGESGAGETGAQEYLQDLLTVPASLAGLPAVSVPAGKGPNGWPIGVTVVGQWGTEPLVLKAAEAIEAWLKETEH